MTLRETIGLEPDARQTDPRLSGIIKLAILAVGGQGGGVLTGWIEDLARAQGYAAQATSVAGVSQRTGATVYYVEMAPLRPGDPVPVFSLMPAPGDVDIMITAEMMEAGRAIIRGFVTPDRTTLITSTHRALAVSEKMVPGDGIASSEEVMAAAGIAARRVIAADFDALAIQSGSVISASLFGALAGAGVLPFPREAFETAIKAGGKGAEASLRAFGEAFDVAANPASEAAPAAQSRPEPKAQGPARLIAEWERLAARASALPAPVAELALPGLRKVVEFQDAAYGAEYLDRLGGVLAQDDAANGWALSRESAKYIANAMAYDDIIRVADLKTCARRFDRIRSEMGVNKANVLHLTEFFHPRAAEIVGLFPARLGARLEADPKWMARLTRWFDRGRRLRTDRLPAFLTLHILGGLKGWRRRTLRHAQEQAHLDRWLQTALSEVARNYDLAVELIRCRRLIKGYSDTHARGHSKFDRVLAATARIAARKDAADWCRRLREAALQDEEGKALDGAIRTIDSFA
ncbi:indolepyruvate oxidoreductase subunit beta family protein [Rhodobacter calidifons]|uniref:Indolepyruvate oxidoreductase subunit beta family protein n=1 Tax=Rhodobacter calidifons TaxID=2715277 RepID=A0ABX0G5T8_9RHOB|nr:indolepyruvate oxidoreductase subunit beta family protein [Rhodobacter calidifons]NHB76628.1 indolepyruvate oxidoreductase subunit beta family protein [Rhodobacter calidifons]